MVIIAKVNAMLTKTCRICGDAYPRTPEHFYFNKRGNPSSYCKECCRAKTRLPDSREKNRIALTKWRRARGQQAKREVYRTSPDGTLEKRCPSCQEWKAHEAHYTNGCNRCKPCVAQGAREYRAKRYADDRLARQRKRENVRQERELAKTVEREKRRTERIALQQANTRVCNHCHTEYPLTTDFFYKRGGKFGRVCKRCELGQQAAKRGLDPSTYIPLKERRKTDPKVWRKIEKARREARQRELPCTLTSAEWEFALEYFSGCCAVCGAPQGLWHRLVPDHWIPLSDPRPDNPGTVATNIVPLCHGDKSTCNISKSNLDPENWLKRKYGNRVATQKLEQIRTYFDVVRSM